MSIRLLTISATASAVLIAATPMVPASMSTDNGGTKSAIDAYSDGGGVVIINQAGDTKFDNSAMNGLVFKYGQVAKTSNTTLKNQVSVLSTDTSAAEKAIAVKFDLAKVVINPPVNGTSCDDGSPQTVSDVWTNGFCTGNNIENQSCNDGNIQTINDKYHNSICGGTNVEGVACDDTNALTFADKYTDGVCAGVTNGTTCNDGNALTFADKYTAGVCAGVTNGTTCNDSNIQTINDIYTSGVCAGTNVEGQSCNDGNIQTISDIYHNGVCAGNNVQGQSCNDGVAHTYADKYNNGVCAGTLAVSCNQIKQLEPALVDGVYSIDYDGSGGSAPFSVYCDMATDGGGWTLVVKAAAGGNGHSNAAAVATVLSPTQGFVGKLSDALITAIPKTMYRVKSSNNALSVYFDQSDSFSSVRQVANKASKTYASPVWEGPFYDSAHRGLNTWQVSTGAFARNDTAVITYTGISSADTCRLGIGNYYAGWCGPGDSATVWVK